MLNTHAFFHRYSIPESSGNDWCRTVDKAVPRRMEACAMCAVKDWIKNRKRMYLFAKPDGTRSTAFLPEEPVDDDNSGAPPPAAASLYYVKNGLVHIADPTEVDKILGVQHYITAWPKIPIEELYASSVQHPHHPSMRWLLNREGYPLMMPSPTARCRRIRLHRLRT